MKLKPYPEYKDSGVPWLGEIPAHWEMERLGSVTTLIVSNVDKHTKENEHPVRLCNYTDVYKQEMLVSSSRYMKASATKEEIARFSLCADDVVITKDSEDWKDIAVPAYVVDCAQDWVCGYHLAILRPKQGRIKGSFLHRCLEGNPIVFQFQARANGVTRYGLTYGDIKTVVIPVPNLEEQLQIALFLNSRLMKINKLIRNKRRLIGLLKEQKQNIINQAVTRGLDPNVKLKPSGVEWLGDIPEHWETVKLKHISFMKSGDNLTSYQIVELGEYPVYGGNGLRGYFNEYNRDGKHLLIGRQGALCGNIHSVEGKFWATEHAIVTSVSGNISIEWYHYMLSVMNLNQYSESAAQPGLSVEKILNLRTILPPCDEQDVIAEYIEREVKPLDQAIARAEREIELMNEYRARLISDVVTGKVDVRGINVPQISDDEFPTPDEETDFEDGLLEDEPTEEEIEEADE